MVMRSNRNRVGIPRSGEPRGPPGRRRFFIGTGILVDGAVHRKPSRTQLSGRMIAIAGRAVHDCGAANLEEKTVKHDPISLRRRHLMIAGAVAIATPSAAFAGQSGNATDVASATMVISGRVLGPDGKPLAGAAIDANNLPGVTATTDADGRFVFTTVSRSEYDRPRALDCRISHTAHRTLQSRIDFARAHVQRDEAGTWRAA